MKISIDCQTCPVRGLRCDDCFVAVLGRTWLDQPRPGLPLDPGERAAVDIFLRQGMVAVEEAQQVRARSESMSEVG